MAFERFEKMSPDIHIGGGGTIQEEGYTPPQLREVYTKAEQSIRDSQPLETTFSDIYPQPEIDKDLRYVERRERQFHESASAATILQEKYAVVMEGLFIQHGELSEWFGADAYTVAAARYDDIKNGVDLVVNLPGEKPGERMHFAVDVTFSNTSVPEKFAALEEAIRGGRLTDIKYYACQDTQEKGGLYIPKVILAINRERVEELAALWKEGKNRELGNHQAQVVFLEEISAQLAYFLRLALAHGHEDIASRIDKIRARIVGLHMQKRALPQRTAFRVTRDEVVQTVLDQCHKTPR